jgi:hypothetical protein
LTDFVAIRIVSDQVVGTMPELFIKPGSEQLKPFLKEMTSNQPSCGKPTLEQARELFGDAALAVEAHLGVEVVRQAGVRHLHHRQGCKRPRQPMRASAVPSLTWMNLWRESKACSTCKAANICQRFCKISTVAAC